MLRLPDFPLLRSLRFPPDQEEAFQADYAQRFLSVTRTALGVSAILMLLFGLLDVWAAPNQTVLHWLWLIRYGLICPAFFIGWLYTFHPAFPKQMQGVVSLVVLVAGLAIAAMVALTSQENAAFNTYYVGMILITLGAYTFIRMRFWYALMTNLLIFASYEVAALFFQRLLELPMGASAFVTANFFFVTANFVGGFASFYLELYARRDFAQRQTIEMEKAKSEQALQQEAAAALRASEAHYRSLIENSSDLISIVNQAGVYQFASPSFEQVLGYRTEEMVGQPAFSFVHPDDIAAAQSAFRQLVTQPNSIIHTEGRLRHKDGSYRVIETSAKLWADGNFVANSRDITHRHQLQDELRRLNNELELRVAERTAEAQRLAATIEATSDLVGSTTLDGQLLYLNKAGRRWLGLPVEGELGPMGFNDFYPPPALTEVQQILGTALTTGQTAVSFETVVYGENQREIPVSMVGIIHRTAEGQPTHLSAIIRDISEIKRAEAELKVALTESRRLAAIIEATPEYVGIADLQGRSLYINSAGKKMIGLPPEKDKKGWSVITCYPEREYARAGEMVQATLRGEAWSGELTLLHQGGHEIPVWEVTFALRDDAGEIEALGTIIRDITAQKQAEAELKAAKEAAEAANRAKSTFLANMSHEIRTPMNAVIGMTSLLLETELSAKQRDFVETIRTSGDSLLTIINDILDFSKIEAEKMELVQRPLDLSDCIESSLDLLAPRAAEKGLDLVYVMAEDVPRGILGDATRLRQILVNLVGNGVKFTEQGEVMVAVTAEPVADSYRLHFAVRDTGIGIAPDKMARLFQSFSQLDASLTRGYGGTGLGLAISKRLAELMGGTMWVESAGADQGATFHFTIRADAAAIPARLHLHNPRPELRSKRLLIVDDNPTNLQILCLQTEMWGMMPQCAAAPSQALTLLEQGHRFDLAILDMHMPEMDGLALAERLREHPGAAALPLIMLTSVGWLPDARLADRFAAFLTKPVKPSQLYDVLVTVLAERAPAITITHRPAADRQTPLADRLPLRILLVEDVAVNQKFALQALEQMGYRGDVAANGLEALAAVNRRPYDVILMDVQMPEMDGLEATRRIHQRWQEADLALLPIVRRPHIIAMTANALQGDRESCLAAGMDDYISKPVYLEELRAALERAGVAAKPSLNGHAPMYPSTSPILDEAVIGNLRQRASGREMIALYLTEATLMLQDLRRAVAEGNAKGQAAATHSLKGSSLYLGARQVASLSAALEQAGRQGQLASPEQLDELEQAFARTEEAFQQFS